MAPHPSRYRTTVQPVFDGFEQPPEQPPSKAEQDEQFRADARAKADAVFAARREFVKEALRGQLFSLKEITQQLVTGIDVPGYGVVGAWGTIVVSGIVREGVRSWRTSTGKTAYRVFKPTGTELDISCPTCMAGKRGKKCQPAPGHPVARGRSHDSREFLWKTRIPA